MDRRYGAPTVPLTEADKLEMDKSYIAFFVIGDNDGTFDADDTPGVIKDPVSLVTTGPLPNNGNSGSSNDDGGSSSGCTVAPRLRMIFWSCSSACRP